MTALAITTADLWCAVFLGVVFGAIIGAAAVEAYRTRRR